MSSESVVARQVVRLQESRTERTDLLANERPLLLHLFDENLAELWSTLTMRTPGDDTSLAAGLLFAEGIIDEPEDVAEFSLVHSDHDDDLLTVRLRRWNAARVAATSRSLGATSSCGLCGRTSAEVTSATSNRPSTAPTFQLATETLYALPARLRAAQLEFEQTGGMHASAMFTPDGQLLDVAEDVGRHNALDKLLGRLFLAHLLPAQQKILLLSGRVSFELVQKAARAGVEVIAALGAPSSLAVSVAESAHISLVGFLRERSANLYHNAGHLNFD